MKNRSFATRVFWWLTLATLAILGIHLLLQYLNLEVYHQQHGQIYELSNRFDLDDESSVPTWFSQLLFLGAGVGSLFIAWLERAKAQRRIWTLIGLVSIVFSMDEIATLHEFALQTLHVTLFNDAPPALLQNAWLVVSPFILATAGFLLWQMIKALPRKTIWIFVASAVTFLVGAIIFDAATSLVDRATFLNQGILVAIEESLELMGVIGAVYAVVDYIETRHIDKIRGALKQLKEA